MTEATLGYGQLMAQVKREHATETKVRAMDAHEIVEWVHRLEDEIEALEVKPDATPALIEALEDVLASANSYVRSEGKDHCPWVSVRDKAPAALAEAKDETA